MNYNQLFKTLLLLLMFSVSADAQEAETSSEDNGMPLRIAYYGDNGVHLGLRVGTSHFLHKKVKLKNHKFKGRQEKKGSKTIVIKYKLDGNLGFYNQPNNHSGFLLGVGVTRHKNKNERKISTAWSFEINYLQRFYNIETYELDENGSINEVGLAGNGGLTFALAPSLERTFGKKGLIVFVKPALQMVKYNHSHFLNAAAELGISLNLSK